MPALGCVYVGPAGPSRRSQLGAAGGSRGGRSCGNAERGLARVPDVYCPSPAGRPPAPHLLLRGGTRRGQSVAPGPWPLERGKLRPRVVQPPALFKLIAPMLAETPQKHGHGPTFLLGTPTRKPLCKSPHRWSLGPRHVPPQLLAGSRLPRSLAVWDPGRRTFPQSAPELTRPGPSPPCLGVSFD